MEPSDNDDARVGTSSQLFYVTAGAEFRFLCERAEGTHKGKGARKAKSTPKAKGTGEAESPLFIQVTAKARGIELVKPESGMKTNTTFRFLRLLLVTSVAPLPKVTFFFGECRNLCFF